MLYYVLSMSFQQSASSYSRLPGFGDQTEGQPSCRQLQITDRDLRIFRSGNQTKSHKRATGSQITTRRSVTAHWFLLFQLPFVLVLAFAADACYTSMT